MKLTLRLATISDVPEILRLNNGMCAEESRLYDPLILPDFATSRAGRAYFKGQLNKTSALLVVAIMDDQIVGYLSANTHGNEHYRKSAKIAEINDMVVGENHRRQGIGRALYQHFTKWAKTRRVKLLRVIASAENERALQFYKSNKFKPMSVMLERPL